GENGEKDRSRAVNALASFAKHVIRANPMPRPSWKHDDANGQARLTVDSDRAPKAARLWVASAPTRDFRLIRWKEQPLTTGQTMVATVPAPATGCTAFFAELDFEIDGLSHQLSTQMRILEAAKQ